MTTDIAESPEPFLAGHVLFARYVLFAVLSGLANLATQELTLRIGRGLPVAVSIIVGTVVGFLVKYALEKRWIFLDRYDSHYSELRKITVYGVFGVATTLLFWIVELSAWHVWQTTTAKYIGAIVGLSLGNWIKYLLDKRFVFGRQA